MCDMDAKTARRTLRENPLSSMMNRSLGSQTYFDEVWLHDLLLVACVIRVCLSTMERCR